MVMARWSLASVIWLALTMSASAQGVVCATGEQAMMTVELLFGRNIGGRLGVTESRWAKFLAEVVTPRFPQGLTVIDGAGQWRDPERQRIVRERSKIVMLVTKDDPPARDRIAFIVADYKTRFRQQSVGVLTRPACASF
jgi:hypothetical protein